MGAGAGSALRHEVVPHSLHRREVVTGRVSPRVEDSRPSKMVRGQVRGEPAAAPAVPVLEPRRPEPRARHYQHLGQESHCVPAPGQVLLNPLDPRRETCHGRIDAILRVFGTAIGCFHFTTCALEVAFSAGRCIEAVLDLPFEALKDILSFHNDTADLESEVIHRVSTSR